MPRDNKARLDIAELRGEIRALAAVIAEREKQVALAFSSVDKATDAALEAQKGVNERQNEIRGAMKDQQATLATRDELRRAIERIESLEKGAAGWLGRSGAAGWVIGLMLALAALAVAFWR